MTEFPDKHVLIMGERYSDGVWNAEGTCCAATELPISDALRERLRHWQLLYDRCAASGDPDQWRVDSAMIAEQGREVARAVKAELPDWTVFFWDDEASLRNRADESVVFEYEIV